MQAPSTDERPSPHLLRPASWDGSRQAGAAAIPRPAGRGRWPGPEAAGAITPAPAGRSAAMSAGGAPQGRDSAAFQHRLHASVNCTTCHSTARGRGDLRAGVVARDCRGCHHGNTALGRDCARCHQKAELSPTRSLAVQVAFSVWPAPKTRSLGFAHDRHTRFACGDCHADTRARTAQKTCESCHVDHHQPDRDCAACHASPRQTARAARHRVRDVGCHVQTGPAVTPVRAVCRVRRPEEPSRSRQCAPQSPGVVRRGRAGS